jgi:hypothetical protein
MENFFEHQRSIVIYEMPNIAIWDFYVAVPPENNGTVGAGMFQLFASFDATETHLDMSGMWSVESDDGRGPDSYVIKSRNLDTVITPGFSRVGTHLWTIIDMGDACAPTFIPTWALSENTPGIEIRRNGTPVYTERANGGSENTSLLNAVTYTIPKPTIWELFVDEETTNTTFGPGASRLTCTFPVTSGNIEAVSNSKLGDMFIRRDAARYLGGKFCPYNRLTSREPYWAHDYWSVIDYTGATSPTFTIRWVPGGQLPGILIKINGVTVNTVRYYNGGGTSSTWNDYVVS